MTGKRRGAFDELVVGNMTAANRFLRAATAESLCGRDGAPGESMRRLYEKLARGGAGVIITGYAYVCPDGKPSEGALSLCEERLEPQMRALVDSVHAAGGRLVAQLVHGGSKSSYARDGARPVGPSALEHPKTRLTSRAASADDIAAIRRAFAEAARRARAWGFDGVEIHAAHGYLLSQFLDGRFNRREDAYGGSIRGRARLACECVGEVRESVGPEYPVFVKLNSCDVREDPAGERGGLSERDSLGAAKLLVEAGASCIEVSGDWHAFSAADAARGPFFLEFGARLADEVDVPVVVTGGWRTLSAVERAFEETRIAGVGLSRPLICEPDLVNRWREGERAPSRCTSCNHCARNPRIPCVFDRRR